MNANKQKENRKFKCYTHTHWISSLGTNDTNKNKIDCNDDLFHWVDACACVYASISLLDSNKNRWIVCNRFLLFVVGFFVVYGRRLLRMMTNSMNSTCNAMQNVQTHLNWNETRCEPTHAPASCCDIWLGIGFNLMHSQWPIIFLKVID